MKLFGLMAEFNTSDELVAAAQSAYDQGYRRMEAYSPFPVHGLAEAVGFHKTRLPALVLLGGLTGAMLGYAMQYFALVVHYPFMVGGKPFHSWPAFIPVSYELTILCAASTAVFGMLLLNGFPKLYHPVFNVPRFERASRDGFFLCLESADPKFEQAGARKFLESLKPVGVYDVDSEPAAGDAEK